jgi:hypothetical protein
MFGVMATSLVLALGQAPPPGQKTVQKKLPIGAVDVVVPQDTATKVQPAELQLQASKVRVPADRDVSKMLVAQGIAATPQALGLFYDLNPTIDDIRKVPEGATVTLPKASGGASVTAAMRAGYKFQLAGADKSFLEASRRKSELASVSPKVSDLTDARFASPQLRQRFITAIQRGRALVDDTLSGKYPLAQQVVTQTAHYADVLARAANAAVGAGGGASGLDAGGPSAYDSAQGPVSQDSVDSTETAAKGVDAINKDLQEGNSGLVMFNVATVTTQPGKKGEPTSNVVPVPLLTVAYHADWDKTRQQFNGPSSPATTRLVVGAIYTMWAEDPTTKLKRSGENTITVARELPSTTLVVK